MPWKLFKLFLSFIRTAVDHPLLKERKNTHKQIGEAWHT
jgi:hypothetical protein